MITKINGVLAWQATAKRLAHCLQPFLEAHERDSHILRQRRLAALAAYRDYETMLKHWNDENETKGAL